ncbi:xylosyl- and glucuronyltransferase LARGE2s-like isoform X2 [Diachasmimorpha longicaudata]|uniref:xylosyl- and glucuronyltransferase LARGE2s-like isoform X2 n=1 Tax=Diachasmimorpha longicaudata TaxID=58733 RepID=UPI0030B909CB
MNGRDTRSNCLSHVLSKINRHVWRMAMARSWLKCLVLLLTVLIIIFLYICLRGQAVESQSPNFISIITPKIPATNTFEFNRPEALKKNLEMQCDALHVALVCAGHSAAQSLVTVVKSIIFHRSRPMHFHLLVDEISRKSLETLFITWDLPQVNVSFYPVEPWIPKISWIPNKHYSGVYGLLKLILPEALSEDYVLVLDTDVTVLTDLSSLWDTFKQFTSQQMLGLAENQSDWYKKTLAYGQSPWPAVGRGYNTGIMLMNLRALRRKKFHHLWVNTTNEVLRDISNFTSLADQDVINAVIKKYPHIVYTLDCGWNVQLSDHTLSEECYRNIEMIKILHWNSPRKQEVRNKHSSDFNRMHRAFLEMDGNLLRRRLFHCHQIEISPYVNRTDSCGKFTMASTIVYRTHLFFLEYEYNIYSDTDITLVTQCSADRISLLDELCKRWPGTISIAVYLTDAELQYFLDFIGNSEALRERRNIGYHIVYKEGEYYPVNYLRNIAISQVSTPYIFQIDVDFLPQVDLYENLMSYIVKLNLTGTDKTALIVPAFETQRYRFTFPTNKDELLKYLNYGILYTFRYHVWTRGHAATNYSFWKVAVDPYEVTWEPDFEPYIVVPKSTPQYDQRFIGFGWNKVSYVTHLTALGYRYVVLPNAFIIHRPHGPSADIGKFRTDPLYRRCLKRLKDKFVEELIGNYGQEALARIKKITKEQ